MTTWAQEEFQCRGANFRPVTQPNTPNGFMLEFRPRAGSGGAVSKPAPVEYLTPPPPPSPAVRQSPSPATPAAAPTPTTTPDSTEGDPLNKILEDPALEPPSLEPPLEEGPGPRQAV